MLNVTKGRVFRFPRWLTRDGPGNTRLFRYKISKNSTLPVRKFLNKLSNTVASLSWVEWDEWSCPFDWGGKRKNAD